MTTYRYSRGYEPYYDYYDPYYRNQSGYYTTRDGRWPATPGTYRHYELPTKSTAARQGVWDHRGWYSDSDNYYRRPVSRTPRYHTQANVWDIMNHHRDDYRYTYPSSRLNTGSVYYDYHGRAHRKLDGRLPPIRRY